MGRANAVGRARSYDPARSRGALAVLVFAALISVYGLSQLVMTLGRDRRNERRDLLIEKDGDGLLRGFTPLEVAVADSPDYARTALCVVAETDSKEESLDFFEGVTEYRIYWHQFDRASDAHAAYEAALARDEWTRVGLPSEVSGGFYDDGACVAHDRVRWQCLHREADTLIVGEVLTNEAVAETPFGPHHALQTGTKGWIDVRTDSAASRRRAIVGAGLLVLVPWGVVAAARGLDE